nr:hypothetical protein [Streptomyces endocoffeicus]
MGQVDGVVLQGEQAGAGEVFEDRDRVGRFAEVEFRAWSGPSGVRGSLTRGDEAQQNTAGEVSLRRGQMSVNVFGGAGDGAVETATRLVCPGGQRAAFAAAPGLEQGVGHQRQGARFALHLVEDARGQSAFHDHPCCLGGLGDGLAQLVTAHRADQHGRVL